jgi:hypothetical protein
MNYPGDIQQNEIESIVTDALTLLRVANPTLPNQYQLPLRLQRRNISEGGIFINSMCQF